MKKTTTIVGIIGAVLTTVGAIFKFFHWPGAGVLLVVGAIALALYMWFYMGTQAKMITNGMEKRFVVLLGTTAGFIVIGFLFKMQHWQGTDSVLKVILILSALLIIVSLIRALVEKNEELRSKYTNTFIWLLGGGIVILYPVIISLFSIE